MSILNELFVNNVPNFKKIDLVNYTGLKKLTLSQLSEMKELEMNKNEVEHVTLSDLSKLEDIDLNSPELREIELKNLPKLTTLNCSKCSKIKKLDLSSCPEIETVFINEKESKIEEILLDPENTWRTGVKKITYKRDENGKLIEAIILKDNDSELTWLYYLLLIPFINISLIILTIYNSRFRGFIVHPEGNSTISMLIRKYLIIDLLIKNVQFVRHAVLKDYRSELKQSPLVRQWTEGYIVPPVHFKDKSIQCTDNEKPQYQQVFDQILSQKGKALWMIIGVSGLGKTALLENWLKYCLQLNSSPFFIKLGSGHSPKKEAGLLLEQYSGICFKEPEDCLPMLKSGGFVIFLDALNEDNNIKETRAFIQQVYKRNLVILTSQYKPRQYESEWKIFDIQLIHLQVFGESQLKQLISDEWMKALSARDDLSNIAILPQTAKLLADYIQNNNKLPDLRLDIYKNLMTNLNEQELINLKEKAWDLFKENIAWFVPDDRITGHFCASAVTQGVLKTMEQKYSFKHERIHRFIVACHLDRTGGKTLFEWDSLVKEGFNRENWGDVLEFLGELYAEKVIEKVIGQGRYYSFLREAVKFDIEIFAKKLYPQMTRLVNLKIIEKNSQFMEFYAQQCTLKLTDD